MEEWNREFFNIPFFQPSGFPVAGLIVASDFE
jgi:hypothetical protein